MHYSLEAVYVHVYGVSLEVKSITTKAMHNKHIKLTSHYIINITDKSPNLL